MIVIKNNKHLISVESFINKEDKKQTSEKKYELTISELEELKKEWKLAERNKDDDKKQKIIKILAGAGIIVGTSVLRGIITGASYEATKKVINSAKKHIESDEDQ